MKIRECQVVFLLLECGQVCVICCVARDRPSPYVNMRDLLRGEGQALALRYWGWCPPWAPRSTGDTRLRAR